MSETTKQSVLIVDDNATNLELLSQLLKSEYRVLAALDGEKALEIMRHESKPDIVLLDIMMPGMDGYEVCQQLKEDPRTRRVPVIFVTALASEQDEERGFEMGAVDYVTKPYNVSIIMARLKTHLALYDQNRELENKVFARTQELSQVQLEIVQRLGRASEFKDNETGLHVIRMSHYSRILGKAAGMALPEQELLFNAAPLHDIGKIGIPDQVLLKPGKLNRTEWVIMQTHCEIGASIIGEATSELLSMAKTVALTHHEKFDGTGYPAGLKGEGIPFVGRIVAIADVFDALVSERPYKKAWAVEEAADYIKEKAGDQFDPQLVSLFLDAMPEVLSIMATYREELHSPS